MNKIENITSACILTCYKEPDYIRAITLREGLAKQSNVDLTVIKNSRTGLLRYPEVIFKLIKTRFSKNPDVYLVTFRGYEILPFVLLLTIGKKVVFDEFINLEEWVVHEHKKMRAGSFAAKILHRFYRSILKRCEFILTDTDSHADLSAELSGIGRGKYLSIPVSTDEKTFSPVRTVKNNGVFEVFYYGNMLPLHGIDYVLEAADTLKKQKDIRFNIVGGGTDLADKVAYLAKRGVNVKYRSWIPYEKLPAAIAKADLCLGGPFGDTFQSQYVITGKAYQFMAMKRPVVIGINKETAVFTNKKNALLVKQADAKSIKHAILWAYANKDQLQVIGSNGRKLYDQKFGSRVVEAKLAQLLKLL